MRVRGRPSRREGIVANNAPAQRGEATRWIIPHKTLTLLASILIRMQVDSVPVPERFTVR
jgi:hypothetical protein